MFARVFNTARRILSRSPSYQDLSAEAKEPTGTRNDVNITMVTSTRRGPVEERTPRSSARKTKRSLETADTPTQSSRKRRKSVGKEAAVIETTALETTPSGKTRITESTTKVAIRPRGASPKVVIRTTISPPVEAALNIDTAQEEAPSNVRETIESTPPPQPAITINIQQATPAALLKQKDTATPKSKRKTAAQTPASAKGSVKRRQEKKAPEVVVDNKMDIEESVAKMSSPAAKATPTPKNTRIRFGSEEPVSTLQIKAPAAPAPAPETVEEDDSDSDEAPEEVTKESALSKTKAAEAEAARAFEAQQEKQERKRKEREERVAEEQKQKRKREEAKAQKLAEVKAREESPVEPEPMEVDMHNLPALLPDSILEAAGDRRPPTPPRLLPAISEKEKRKEKLKRHIKFLERGEKPIKDVKKGSLKVRVLEQQNALLGPKVNKDTMNVREKWLKGRHGDKKQKKGRGKMEFKKVERRPVGSGFLRGDD